MRLTARDFQSWEEFTLTLGKLTVLVGPSDTGKSAIFRALMGLIRNEVEADQIRVGQGSTEVTLEVQGHTITLLRPAKDSNRYIIDGKPYKHGGTGIPTEIQDLNMGHIQIGDMKLDPIFSGQHDSKFMLQDIGPTQMNTILGAFSSTEKLESGKREANARVVQKNQEARTIATEVNESEKRKHSLEELQGFTSAIVGDIQLLEWEIAGIEDVLQTYKTTAVSLEHLVPIRSLINSVRIPELTETQVLQSLVSEFRNCHSIHTRSRLIHRILEQANNSKSMWDNLLNTFLLAVQYNNTVFLAETRKVFIDDLIEGIEHAVQNSDNLLAEFTDKRAIYKYLIQAAANRESALSCVDRLEQTNRLLDDYQKQESELKQQIDTVTCPKCGANFCIHEEVNV